MSKNISIYVHRIRFKIYMDMDILVSYINVSIYDVISLKYERITPSSFSDTAPNVVHFVTQQHTRNLAGVGTYARLFETDFTLVLRLLYIM